MTISTPAPARLAQTRIVALHWAPAWLFLGALLARAVAAAAFPDPAYPDSFYYTNVAQQLASGNGFRVDYLWNFVEVGGKLPPYGEAVLPIPSDAHWMPLAALVQVPFIWLLGVTPFAQGLPFWIAAAAAAPLTYLIGRDAGLDEGLAITGGALAAVPGAVTPFLSQTDNFALFMPLGALALWLCSRGMRGSRRAFVLGGAVVGLATLSRTDGVLLALPFALAFLSELRRRPPGDRRIAWAAAAGCAIAFGVVVAPWFARQLAVFGSLTPSAANGRILLISRYRELYSVTSDTSLAGFLSQGPASLAASRVGGLVAAGLLFAAMPLLLYLVPFVVDSAWRTRRQLHFRPWRVYAVTLFLASGLLFAVHVPSGSFMHSAVALLPHAYLLATMGIAGAVGWVAERRSSWDAPRATRVMLGGAVAITAVASGGATLIASGAWSADRSTRMEVVPALAATPDGDRIMSADAGAYRYLTGRGGIVTPDDPLPVIEGAARAYGIRWLVLERAHLVEALKPVLGGTVRPAWLSRPIVSVGGPLPRIALYAVCLETADARCSRS